MGDRLATIDMGEKEGIELLCPTFFGRGAGSTSNTMWPRPRSTSVPNGISIHPAVWPQQTWAKNWSMCPFGRSWVPIKHNVAWAEVYLPTKWHLDRSSHLATIYMGRKVRGCSAPVLWLGLGPQLTQCHLGLGLSPYQVAC